MNISELFTLSYYFDLTPNGGTLSIFLAIYFLLILALRAHLRLVAGKHEHRKIARKLQKTHLSRLAIIATLGVLNIGARHIGLAFFSMRIWAYFLVLWSFYELWNVYQVFQKRIHTHIETHSPIHVDKYIPHKKTRKKKRRR
ncbi:hypothetical protein HOG48_03610 [Candidatus Peregrinibacteria bacterium]|jgi:hypothetical protein|nr:hypothetical protein [Candidatus Peregrinibacteria bacterium]